MESCFVLYSRSKAGVFTTTVHVHPGRYEYKFDVDGQDMLDVNQVGTGFHVHNIRII